nr:Plug domain-containing protein [Xanthomonas arboricola]
MASGITKASNLGGLWDSDSRRGFTGDPNFGSDYMVNGFNASRGYGLRDAANTQSIEMIKGPAWALYGRGEPGGAGRSISLPSSPCFSRSTAWICRQGASTVIALRSTAPARCATTWPIG